MGLNVFFDSSLVLVKALCINLENENHSPGGHARRRLKKMYFLASFGQLGDNFEAFVDVPVKQVIFHVFEKTTNTSEFRYKTVENMYFWTRIFEWSMFTVMHSGKTSKIEKCSPGEHVHRESKKSRFFQFVIVLGRFRSVPVKRQLMEAFLFCLFLWIFLKTFFSCKAIYEY